MSEHFSLSTRQVPNGVLVEVAGELDVSTVGQLADHLDALAGTVVVDLSAATFCDSSGLNVLFQTSHRLRESGGTLQVRKPNAHLRRVFDVAGLDHLVERDAERSA